MFTTVHSVLEIVLLRLLTLTGILAAKTAKLHADGKCGLEQTVSRSGLFVRTDSLEGAGGATLNARCG